MHVDLCDGVYSYDSLISSCVQFWSVLQPCNLCNAGFLLLSSDLRNNFFCTLLSNTNKIADVIFHTHTSPEYFKHRDGIKKESACGKCIEMETQLKKSSNRAQFCRANYWNSSKRLKIWVRFPSMYLFIFIRIVACATLDLSNYVLQN